MKNFKFRFSYFILIGILGFLLKIFTFFSFNNVEITKYNLTNSLSNEKFLEFISNNFLLILGSIFIIIMQIGYLIGEKKYQKKIFTYANILSITSELVIIVSSLAYIILASINRVDMFNYKTNNPLILSWMVNIKNLFILISYFSLVIFSLGIFKVKDHSKFSKSGVYVLGGINLLSFILFLGIIVTSKYNSGLDMLSNLYELKAMPPYNEIYPSINGFTLAQFKRLSYVFIDVEAKNASSIFTLSATMAMASQVLYLVSFVGNLYFLLTQLIESFDIERDEKWREI